MDGKGPDTGKSVAAVAFRTLIATAVVCTIVGVGIYMLGPNGDGDPSMGTEFATLSNLSVGNDVTGQVTCDMVIVLNGKPSPTVKYYLRVNFDGKSDETAFRDEQLKSGRIGFHILKTNRRSPKPESVTCWLEIGALYGRKRVSNIATLN